MLDSFRHRTPRLVCTRTTSRLLALAVCLAAAVWPAPATAQTAQGSQPNLLLAANPVKQGGTVGLSGHAPASGACASVTLSSDAFAGSTSTGAAKGFTVPVSSTDQSFAAKLDLSYAVDTGSYTVSATCSPGTNAETPFATAGLVVQSLLPLDHTLHAQAQWAAFGILAALIILVLLLLKGARVFRGFDNRLSTSKTIALMWTPVVAYLVAVLAFIGSGGGYGLWKALVGSINGVYLVLLGAPFAGAVGAKAIVSTRVANGSLQKRPAPQSGLGSSGLSDLFKDDNGDFDVIDSQYLLLNAVAIIVVLVQFVHRPGFGAPDLPWFLGALTGTSAGTYLANKAIQTNDPVITNLTPGQARMGQSVQAVGANLNSPAAADVTTVVTVGGNPVDSATISATASVVAFRVPVPAAGAAYPPNAAQQVVVTTAARKIAVSPQDLTVIEDNPTPTGAQPGRVRPGDTLTVTGDDLFAAGDLTFGGAPVSAAAPQIMLHPNAGGNPIACPRTVPPGSTDGNGQVTVTVPQNSPPGAYTISARGKANDKLTVNLGPAIESVNQNLVNAGQNIIVCGQMLFPSADLTGDKPKADADPHITLTPKGGGDAVNCPRKQPPDGGDTNSQVVVKVPDHTPAGDYIVNVQDADPTASPVDLQVIAA